MKSFNICLVSIHGSVPPLENGGMGDFLPQHPSRIRSHGYIYGDDGNSSFVNFKKCVAHEMHGS